MSNKNNHKLNIKYIENKQVNQTAVGRYLSISATANHWTNFGPLAKQLEARLTEILELDESLRVVVCCNATVALHALVAMFHSIHNKPLRWISPAFGFYSSADGILADAEIIDCDHEAMLDIDQLDPNNFDGVIATNIFGQKSDMHRYRDYAQQHNKILIVDSAMGFQAGGHVANECISLHHTKPWGFGEGGCAIVHKDNETLFRSLISFGHDNFDASINRLAINGKISDIACAYILGWLDQFDELKHDYNEQYQRIARLALESGFSILSDKHTHPSVPASVPLLLPEPDSIPEVNIPVARYYYPLSNATQAWGIYNRIVNVACHRELKQVSDENIKAALDTIFRACTIEKRNLIQNNNN